MRILIHGMGTMGSLYAVRLAEAGHQVVGLDEGQRLDELREHGVVLEDAATAERETRHIEMIDKLEDDDSYDLIMVAMPKHEALEILPTLAANSSSTILFMMSNIGGFGELTATLGRERAMVGFPLPGGDQYGHVMRIVGLSADRTWELPIGEVDGRVTPRTRRVAAILESMRGFTVVIRTDMDAWLKFHNGGMIPLVAALYAADLNSERLARTPDAMLLGIRGLKEAVRGLREMGIPPSASVGRAINWLPEPVLVPLFARIVTIDDLQAVMVGYPREARDEMRYLADELLSMLHAAGIETPNLDRLYHYMDTKTLPIYDGSNEIGMDWRPLWVPALAVGTVVGLIAGLKYVRRNGQSERQVHVEVTKTSPPKRRTRRYRLR